MGSRTILLARTEEVYSSKSFLQRRDTESDRKMCMAGAPKLQRSTLSVDQSVRLADLFSMHK